MKKLLIDINSIIPFYTQGHATGIGRSTMELLKALSDIKDIPFEIILFSQNTKGVMAKKDFPFRYLHFFMPNRYIFKKISNTLHLRYLCSKYDLIHIPHNTDCVEDLQKTIFTIHDVIVRRYPEMWGLKNNSPFFDELKYIFDNCKAIVTCSEASKNDICDLFTIPANKVTSIAWGVNRNLFHPVVDHIILKQLGINDMFYFSASCNHTRKNTPMLLEAYRSYINYGGCGQLVLLNPKKEDLSNFTDLIDCKKIIVCKNVSDYQLTVLYSCAHCSIVVSEYEGFGLPVLESLACHTIVLCAKNSSLIEAGGEVVDYFEKLDSKSICNKMLSYDKKNKAQTIDIESIERHLNNFTWEQCALNYVKFYSKQLDCQ
jgi:putative mannosyltransferase